MNKDSCPNCNTKKTWEGDDIECAFKDGSFSNDNWCCGIMDDIRDYILHSPDSGGHCRIDHRYCDDYEYASICIDDISLNDQNIGLCLWVSWYKNRGKTDQLVILDHNGARVPTLEEISAILNVIMDN